MVLSGPQEQMSEFSENICGNHLQSHREWREYVFQTHQAEPEWIPLHHHHHHNHNFLESKRVTRQEQTMAAGANARSWA